MSVHSLILTALRKAYEDNPIRGFEVLADSDTNFIVRHLFQNYRNANGEESGLHLSEAGQLVVGRYFKQWAVNLTSSSFGSRELIFLDRTCQMPWHVVVRDRTDTGVNLTLFLMEAEFAMRAKLVGDLDALKTAFKENPHQGQ